MAPAQRKPPRYCEVCGKEITGQGLYFCSRACNKIGVGKHIQSSYTPELKERRSIDTKRQMQIPGMRERRREATKKWRANMTEEQKEKAKVNHKIAMERTEVREKLSDAHRGCVDYRKIAIEAHGTCCQRCGTDLKDETNKLVVHHRDGEHYIDEITDNSPENLMVLCRSCHTALHAEMRRQSDRFTGQYHFEQAANEILLGLKQMGLEPDWENFHDTPKRFARAYQEIFEGVVDTEGQVEKILATTFPADGSETMVTAMDITCFSMCPHHLLPVEYHVCVGYIPDKDGQVLGISKLSRLVTILAKRPALQETFTQQIVDCLAKIGVQGAVALVEGQHMCMRMRGAVAVTSSITTTAISGVFEHDPTAKSEFMTLISDRMRFRK